MYAVESINSSWLSVCLTKYIRLDKRGWRIIELYKAKHNLFFKCRIFIVGFGLYGSSNGSADYAVRWNQFLLNMKIWNRIWTCIESESDIWTDTRHEIRTLESFWNMQKVIFHNAGLNWSRAGKFWRQMRKSFSRTVQATPSTSTLTIPCKSRWVLACNAAGQWILANLPRLRSAMYWKQIWGMCVARWLEHALRGENAYNSHHERNALEKLRKIACLRISLVKTSQQEVIYFEGVVLPPPGIPVEFNKE